MKAARRATALGRGATLDAGTAVTGIAMPAVAAGRPSNVIGVAIAGPLRLLTVLWPVIGTHLAGRWAVCGASAQP
jgi:hypothetical protein